MTENILRYIYDDLSQMRSDLYENNDEIDNSISQY